MKAGKKGYPGYFRAERKRRSLIAFLLLLLPVALLILGIVFFGSRRNLLTVLAFVLVIPFAMMLVQAIMAFLQKPMDAGKVQAVQKHAEGLMTAYELYVTHETASTFVDALAICGTELVGYVDTKKGDPDFTAAYIQKSLRAEGMTTSVHLMTEFSAFLARLDTLREHAESLREKLPGGRETEEKIWLQLCQISL